MTPRSECSRGPRRAVRGGALDGALYFEKDHERVVDRSQGFPHRFRSKRYDGLKPGRPSWQIEWAWGADDAARQQKFAVELPALAPDAKHALPAMYNLRDLVRAGGLVSYDTSITDATAKPASMSAES
jgi:hypothetical protein